MDWGTFDQYKFGDEEPSLEDQGDDKEVDVIGQLTKFAFDSAVGNLKNVGIVMFIESKLIMPKVEKTCKFLNMAIDDPVTYGSLV